MTGPIALPTAAALALVAALASFQSAFAGTYKCIQPSGAVVYQQTPCPADAAGGELAVDASPPGGAEALEALAEDPDAYSVERQLKAMESARDQGRTSREAPGAGAGQDPAPTYDRARCAKHRAESARWEYETSRGYRTPQEREYRAGMLEHHQALVERYCTGE
jgi:hypothetical protein